MYLKNLFIRNIIVLVALSFAITANAKKNKAEAFVPYEASPVTIDDELYQKTSEIQKKSNATRNPNQVVDRTNTDKLYATDFREIKADLDAIVSKKTLTAEIDIDLSNQLDAVLVKWGSRTDLSDQAKWTVAQLRVLKAFRGFTVRARPLFERLDYRFSHTAIITWMRGVFAGFNAYLPTPQWKAGLAYITTPHSGMRSTISSEQDLRQFINTEVLPLLNHAHKDILSLVFDANNSYKTIRSDFKPFYFDNEILYTSANFVSENDRHMLITRSEVLALLSAYSLGLGGAYTSLAYSWEGLLSTVTSLGAAYGMGTFIDPSTMTAKKRVQIINSQSNLFNFLANNGGPKAMQTAHVFVRSGLQFAKLAWIGTSQDPILTNARAYNDMGINNAAPFLDPRVLNAFNRVLNTTFINVDNLIANKGITSALVNGESVTVNFDALFTSPPANLRAFLPTQFVGDQDGEVSELTIRTLDGKRTNYRNYRYGNPKAWNYTVYTKYFSGATNAAGVRKANQVLSQAWGGFLVGIPLSVNQF